MYSFATKNLKLKKLRHQKINLIDALQLITRPLQSTMISKHKSRAITCIQYIYNII